MKEMYSHELPIWLKAMGACRVNRDSIDFKWGYFSPRFGLELLIHRGHYFENQYAISFCLGWGNFHIKLPFRTKLEPYHDWPSYGLQVYGNSLWIRIGDHEKNQRTRKMISWDFPFITLIFDAHEVQRNDGLWVPYVGSWEHDKTPDGRHEETHHFTYVLRSGDVQKRNATVFKERRKYHRKWLPFMKKTFTCIDIAFDGEVGERTGSWKGGTIGCSWEILPGESMESCLRRMESQREFR